MTTPQRILDANGNRAREALRVLEEAARFLLDDADDAEQLKRMRHELAHALAAVPGLIHHRDTPGDVGAALTTPTEQRRASLRDVVTAAGARLSEALRAVEEYAKPLAHEPGAAELAQLAEQWRYRGYDLAQRLSRALGGGRSAPWRLCLLLTESLCTHHGWRAVLRQAIDHGADAVQVREKTMDGDALLERVREVVAIVDRRAAVLVNDRPDVALLAGADGVHLGQADLSPLEVRKLAGDRLVIGVSTSDLDQARRARAEGADYCGVGPMFATTTKHKPALAGPAYLRAYLGWGGLAHLAIGGVTPANVGQLAEAGCWGVAVSSAVCGAADPGQACRKLLAGLGVTPTSGT